MSYPTIQEELISIGKRKKILLKKIKDDKIHAKNVRNILLKKKEDILDDVQSIIYEYRKLGKKSKFEFEIFDKIVGVIENSLSQQSVSTKKAKHFINTLKKSSIHGENFDDISQQSVEGLRKLTGHHKYKEIKGYTNSEMCKQ